MRRKYRDCRRDDGNCTLCDLVVDGRDCRGRLITKLEWYRLAAGLSQQQLAAAAGMNYTQVQKVELGKADAGNLAARNLISLAEALGVEPKDLL